jgi:hypothetical protein
MPAVDKFASGEVIVFGPNGVMVKARTANQRKMVDSIKKAISCLPLALPVPVKPIPRLLWR